MSAEKICQFQKSFFWPKSFLLGSYSRCGQARTAQLYEGPLPFSALPARAPPAPSHPPKAKGPSVGGFAGTGSHTAWAAETARDRQRPADPLHPQHMLAFKRACVCVCICTSLYPFHFFVLLTFPTAASCSKQLWGALSPGERHISRIKLRASQYK